MKMNKISAIYRTKSGEEYTIACADFEKIKSVWKNPVDQMNNRIALRECQKICQHITIPWLYQNIGRRTKASEGALRIARPLWKKSPKEVSNQTILKMCEDAGFKVSLGYLYLNLKPRSKKRPPIIEGDKKKLRQLWLENPPSISSTKIAKQYGTTINKLERVFGKRQSSHNSNEKLINQAVQSVKHLWLRPKTEVRTKEIVYKSQEIYPNMTEFIIRNRLGKRIGISENKESEINKMLNDGKTIADISRALNISRYILLKTIKSTQKIG